MDWSDLQTVLAVVEHEGLQGASRALGVHPTTVSRRLRELEASQGAALFERYRHGVVLTDAGADAVEVSRQIRELANGLEARLEGRDTRLSGSIRLTSVDTILQLWMPRFAAFQQRYPDIDLEVSSAMAMVNLTQREADVAVRIASEAPGHLVGSKVCDVAHGVYVSHDLYASFGPNAKREDYPWVGYDLAVFRGIDGFLAARHPSARIVLRVPRIGLVKAAIEGGVGIGILNCHAGDSSPMLRRLGPPDAGVSHLWVLTHPELRGAARISAMLSYLREIAREDLDLFEGQRPQAVV